MRQRKRIDRKLLPSRKLSLNKRFSDTPKKLTSERTRRNIIRENAESNNEDHQIGKSPNKRRSNISHNLSVPSTTSEMLKGCFKIFKVSPFYNFHQTALKTYARKLKDEVSAFNCNRENVKYGSSLQIQKLSLTGHSYDVLQVLLSANNNKYEGYFISFEESTKQEDSNQKLFPVLFAKGSGKLMQQVHNALCKFFDCDIYSVRFTSTALTVFFTSMCEMFIKVVPDLESEAAILHYKIPGCPESDSIQVALSLAATSTVLAVFSSKFGNTSSYAQIVSGFYGRILQHLQNIYQVDLSCAELSKVIFPGFAVSSGGLVKFAGEQVLKITLPIIEEYSLPQYITY